MISAGRLATNLKTVRVVTGEAVARFSSAGFGLIGVDEATTVRVATFLAAEAFETYSLENEETLGLDVSRVADAVAQFEDDTSLTVSLHGPPQRLTIEGEHLQLSFGLLDPEAMRAVPDPPEVSRSIRFAVDGRPFSRAVRACSLVYADTTEAEDGDSEQQPADIAIGVDVESDAVYTEAEGDTDVAHYELQLEEFDAASDSENLSTRYGLDNLRDIARPIPAGAEVTSLLGDQLPLRLRWLFAEANGSVEYDVAPVVSDMANVAPLEEKTQRSDTDANLNKVQTITPALPPGIESNGDTLRIRGDRLSEFIALIERRPEVTAGIQRVEIVSKSGDSVMLTVDDGVLTFDYKQG